MDEIWKTIVQVHQQAKSLMLIAEELDPEFSTFVQPVRELRDALEHIVRAKAVETGIAPPPNNINKDDYIRTSYGKALGHEYRAFFDVADWLSMTIREKVLGLMEDYSKETITNVVPSYYQEWRPAIEKVSIEIARIRDSKDIADKGKILSEVQEYRDKIDELLEIHEQLLISIPALQEYSKKERKAAIKDKIWKVLIPIMVALAASTITALIK